MTALTHVAPTVAKLVRLLGSDQDHETLAAARALKRVLNSVELDFHDLANVVEFAARHETLRLETTTNNPHRASAQAQMIKSCREYSSLLTNKERTFICSMATWRGELSPRQFAWLYAIYERVEGERI
jgi:predicted nuclease of predicted toxin-antitoxin system